jgi:hypothetical protein
LKINISNITKGFLPLLFLVTAYSCNREATDIGVNLRPDGGAINSDYLELNNYICRTIDEDSLRTDTLSVNTLGVINDPDFGIRKASLIIQPLIEELDYDFSSNTVDSVVLVLKYFRSQFADGIEQLLIYGDTNSSITIDAYRLGEDIVSEDRYYSNFNPTLGTGIGTFSGTFNFLDSVQSITGSDTDVVAPEFRMKLDQSFGQDIFNQSTSVFSSQENFLDYLKGIVLIPNESGLASGSGAIVGVNAFGANSYLRIYYDGTESVDLVFNASSERINLWSVTNSPAAITNQTTGSGHFNTCYMQSLSGNKVRVDLPQLDSLIEAGSDIVINEARLSVKVDQSFVTTDFPAPYRALLTSIGDDGSGLAIIDFIDDVFPPNSWFGYTNYGGRYSSTTGEIEFHFNRYLQELIEDYKKNGTNNFKGFFLSLPSDFPIVPSRAVLNTDSSLDGIKVSVAYTKLN